MTTVLEVEDLSVNFDGNLVVDNISLKVEEGDLLGIIGPNGSGKTTLFRAILGLQPHSGKVKMFGYEGSKLRTLLPLIGYVPQRVSFEPNFPATVYDIVSMGIISNKKLVKGDKLIQQCGRCWNMIYKNKNDKVTQALKTVGLESLRNRRIGQLSGGELRRVFIARCLVKDPLLLILDEPATSVDVESSTKFYEAIKKINEENKITILWSSHDLEAVSKYAKNVVCMNKKLFYPGLPVTILNYAFVVLASITVVTSMRLVGILLISALVVLPNITAMMFGKGFKKTLGISMLISVASVVSGILLSYYYNVAPSGVIVVIAVVILVGVLGAKSAGLISKIEMRKHSQLSHS